MESPDTFEKRVRISLIGGRYLVFDIQNLMQLRRQHGICGVHTGTMAQSTTQNLFLSLPIELYAEEARLLVDKGAAYVADDAAAHLTRLKHMDEGTKRAYIQSIKTQRKNAQSFVEQQRAASAVNNEKIKAAKVKESAKSKDSVESEATEQSPPPAEDEDKEKAKGDEEGVFDAFNSSASSKPTAAKTKDMVAVTPATSGDLVDPSSHHVDVAKPESHALYAYLNRRGYYFTPGLRFGGDYSVYPGDPFRYHAHFLAKNYAWDEEIDMLDIVASGRLGTTVKKGFLIGGHQPEARETGDPEAEDGVRTFCIEWGGM